MAGREPLADIALLGGAVCATLLAVAGALLAVLPVLIGFDELSVQPRSDSGQQPGHRVDHRRVDRRTCQEWRTALASVQGIYLIADTTGKLYVAKADGGERLLGRWTACARDGHRGNVAMRKLAEVDMSHRGNFVFSILRVFGPSTPTAEVDQAESHDKQALLTRQYGLNRN